MKLPYHERAYVPREKLTHYLLSETHMVGKLKAKFFNKIGFDEGNSQLLEEALIKIATEEEVISILESPHGKKYVIDGTIQIINEEMVKVRTVWILEENRKEPRFITAYPV